MSMLTLAEFDGFIPGSRASLMLDVVVLGMVVIVPVLAWSLYLVKVKKAYALHGVVQLVLGIVLLVVVVLFEVDVRIHGWRHRAEDSPYFDGSLFPVLYIHLVFAVTTTLLWLYTVIGAVRGFDRPAAPNAYSPRHRKVAGWSAMTMFATAITGWLFYYMAFVA